MSQRPYYIKGTYVGPGREGWAVRNKVTGEFHGYNGQWGPDVGRRYFKKNVRTAIGLLVHCHPNLRNQLEVFYFDGKNPPKHAYYYDDLVE